MLEYNYYNNECCGLKDMSVYEFDNSVKIKEIIKKENITMLVFWTDWCAPFRDFDSVINQIASEFPDVDIYKINLDKWPEFENEFNITSLPATFYYKNSKQLGNHIGVPSAHQLEGIVKKTVV